MNYSVGMALKSFKKKILKISYPEVPVQLFRGIKPKEILLRIAQILAETQMEMKKLILHICKNDDDLAVCLLRIIRSEKVLARSTGYSTYSRIALSYLLVVLYHPFEFNQLFPTLNFYSNVPFELEVSVLYPMLTQFQKMMQCDSLKALEDGVFASMLIPEQKTNLDTLRLYWYAGSYMPVNFPGLSLWLIVKIQRKVNYFANTNKSRPDEKTINQFCLNLSKNVNLPKAEIMPVVGSCLKRHGIPLVEYSLDLTNENA